VTSTVYITIHITRAEMIQSQRRIGVDILSGVELNAVAEFDRLDAKEALGGCVILRELERGFEEGIVAEVRLGVTVDVDDSGVNRTLLFGHEEFVEMGGATFDGVIEMRGLDTESDDG
jgi:hypothetical protein